MITVPRFVLSVGFIYIASYFKCIEGHGRLMDPPSRSSLWRDPNFQGQSPKNYDDNALYCGGFNHQWTNMGGRCGICGDAYDDNPRENEPPNGRYANGIISRQLTEGQVYDVSVEITAYHKGWFEFRICPNNNVNQPATQGCLDQNLLKIAGSQETRYDINHSSRSGPLTHSIPLQMPLGLVCSQCVLQWKYHTGNSWGVDPNGHGCVGCGPQEEFYGCADISITSSSGPPAPTPPLPSSTTTTPPTTTTTTIASAPNPSSTPAASTCRGAGSFANVAGMDQWCQDNCRVGYCPASHCQC